MKSVCQVNTYVMLKADSAEMSPFVVRLSAQKDCFNTLDKYVVCTIITRSIVLLLFNVTLLLVCLQRNTNWEMHCPIILTFSYLSDKGLSRIVIIFTSVYSLLFCVTHPKRVFCKCLFLTTTYRNHNRAYIIMTF